MSASTLLLAALLVAMALLALGVLRYLHGQRQAIRSAWHKLGAERSLRRIAGHVPVAIFTLHDTAEAPSRLDVITGDPAALIGLDAVHPLGEGDPLRDPAFRQRIPPEDLSALDRLLESASHPDDKDRPQALDFRVRAPAGLRWMHLTLAPSDGDAQRVGYMYDTTRTKALNEELRSARDAAERAAKARSDFLATMSHEIRTPLNGVIGMLELLGHTRLDAEQKQMLHSVEDSAGALMQILNDVLDFSKLAAGGLQLENEAFDPRALVDNVIGAVAAPMQRKGLRVDVLVESTVASRLMGDGIRIRQVLFNLLNNATKFTAQGSIALMWRVIGDGDGAQRSFISVRDTGIGIPADKQATLFTPFNQAENSTTRHYGGTGLGLAICKQLVELMGGHVSLQSAPGEGTTVTLELHLPIVHRAVDALPGAAQKHAILRLSDERIAIELAEQLIALGFTVERIPPSQSMRPGMVANVLFVDADDLQSATEIAARVVAVGKALRSEPSIPNDERIPLEVAPLRWQSLVQACRLALEPPVSSRRKAAVATDASAAAIVAKSFSPHTQRVLVVEDHPVSQQLVRRQLDLLGWPCDIVGNGVDALAALHDGDYAMLVTDCNMPRMSGYELATAWRKHEAESGAATRLPIIAMTANAFDGELARCREAGMDDYLSKPLQLQPLERKIEQWMPRRGPDAAQAAPEPSPAADMEASQALRQSLLPMLVDATNADLDALGAAAIAGDAKIAEQRLHRMLGALQLFTDDPLLAEGERYLETLHAGGTDPLRSLPGYVGALRQLLARLG
ncbi:response regulator [Rhodanobacter sp. DHG33]|nr:response regulator [Rhodanobacter sp. DHG33]